MQNCIIFIYIIGVASLYTQNLHFIRLQHLFTVAKIISTYINYNYIYALHTISQNHSQSLYMFYIQ